MYTFKREVFGNIVSFIPLDHLQQDIVSYHSGIDVVHTIHSFQMGERFVTL